MILGAVLASTSKRKPTTGQHALPRTCSHRAAGVWDAAARPTNSAVLFPSASAGGLPLGSYRGFEREAPGESLGRICGAKAGPYSQPLGASEFELVSCGRRSERRVPEPLSRSDQRFPAPASARVPSAVPPEPPPAAGRSSPRRSSERRASGESLGRDAGRPDLLFPYHTQTHAALRTKLRKHHGTQWNGLWMRGSKCWLGA